MPRVIVASGFVAQYPNAGGVFSVVLQYLLGLRRLGYSVCWLELLWPQGPSDHTLIRTFAERLAAFGLEQDFCLVYFPQGKWPEAGATREWNGWSQERFSQFARSAEVSLDLCASVRVPDLLAEVRQRLLLDLDPGFMQLWMHQWDMGQRHYDQFFTVGQNIGQPDCPVPTGERRWRTFWPPVVMDLWGEQAGNAEAPFSTVSQWWGYPPTYYDGEVYDGSKRVEFLRFVDLPRLSGHQFQMALNLHPVDDTADKHLLIEKGWQVHEAHQVVGDFSSYRQYLLDSCGEFSVAKPGYIKSRSGWLSDRSVCYLAAGRPVLVQETGVSAYLPTGRGILTFSSLEEAVAGVEEIQRNYQVHSQAAREIAQEYFAAEKVLAKLLHDAGL
jgi:hypothetical protein